MLNIDNFCNEIKLKNSNKVFKYRKPTIKDLDFLLESFYNNYKINDIEKENLDYLNKNILIVESENNLLGFIKIYYKASLNAYGFNTFLHPNTSPKLFKDFTIYSCYNLSKGLSFLDVKVYNFYLDVASLVIAKWVKQVSVSLKTFKIYDEYIICYTSFSNLHLKNILLNIE